MNAIKEEIIDFNELVQHLNPQAEMQIQTQGVHSDFTADESTGLLLHNFEDTPEQGIQGVHSDFTADESTGLLLHNFEDTPEQGIQEPLTYNEEDSMAGRIFYSEAEELREFNSTPAEAETIYSDECLTDFSLLNDNINITINSRTVDSILEDFEIIDPVSVSVLFAQEVRTAQTNDNLQGAAYPTPSKSAVIFIGNTLSSLHETSADLMKFICNIGKT